MFDNAKITRRNLLKCAAIGAAGVTSASFLATQNPASKAYADQLTEVDSENQTNYQDNVTEVMDADIVVVGSGSSGVSAAAEALEHSANVVLIESQGQPGGSGALTHCILGINTPDQIANNITDEHPSSWDAEVLSPLRPANTDVTVAEIAQHELKSFNGITDGARWITLLENSADNIQWLLDQGVQFLDGVDNYQGEGLYNVSHWWKDKGYAGFITPMLNKFNELGGTILLNTTGKELITDDSGAVVGIYAETENGVLQINAKAVIIATGGYNDNADIMKQRGFNPEEVLIKAAPGHNGDGILMALAAGAKSWLDNSLLMQFPMNSDMGIQSSFLCSIPFSIWVNEDAVRFANEDLVSHVPGRGIQCLQLQNQSFAILDQAKIDELTATNEEKATFVAENIESGNIVKEDTIEALAEKLGLASDILANTVAQYNDFCAAQADGHFAKDPSCQKPYEEGPYYGYRNNDTYSISSIGGISTTRKSEVRAANGGVVPGLYAVGMDGAELWRGIYTINVPGSANAFNVDSGRTAAREACSLL